MKKIDGYTIPCEVIDDLLPSYIDSLTNAVTNEAVEEHLKKCPSCREKFEAMKFPLAEQEEFPVKKSSDAIDQQGMDFLRQVKRRNVYKIVASVLLAVLSCMLLFYTMVVVIHPFAPEAQNVYQLDDGRIYFELRVSGKQASVDSISYLDFSDEAGEYHVNFGYSWLSLLQGTFNREEKIYCFVREMPENSIHYSCGDTDLVIWQKGDEIDTAPDNIEAAANGKENLPFWNRDH